MMKDTVLSSKHNPQNLSSSHILPKQVNRNVKDYPIV